MKNAKIKNFIKANKFSLMVAMVVVMAINAVVGAFMIGKQYAEMKAAETTATSCGGENRWVLNSEGSSTFVTPYSYVEEKYAVEETADTQFGVSYNKSGDATFLDIDCDVKEAFEILDCVRMHVAITYGDVVLHRAYVKMEDGFTYLVETDSNGTVLKDENGSIIVLQRCDFADLYLGSEE